MAKLIKKLQQKEYAKSVYAFTSLYNFLITLESEYKTTATKDTISISFDGRTKTFGIVYYDVRSNLGVVYRCIEKQTVNLVDAFVLRLFLTEKNEILRIEVEVTPSCQIGQQVETILDDYNHTYHKGKIYQIEKHQKQNRFMYFIEENGKKIKKRYFKDNLKVIKI